MPYLPARCSTYDKLEVGHASVGMEDWFNDRVTGQQFKFQINLGLGGHHGPIDSKRSEDLAERGLFLGCLSLGKFFSQAVQVNVLIRPFKFISKSLNLLSQFGFLILDKDVLAERIVLGELQLLLVIFQGVNPFANVVNLIAQGPNPFPVIHLFPFDQNLKRQPHNQDRDRIDDEQYLRKEAGQFLIRTSPFQLFLFL